MYIPQFCGITTHNKAQFCGISEMKCKSRLFQAARHTKKPSGDGKPSDGGKPSEDDSVTFFLSFAAGPCYVRILTVISTVDN